MTLECGITINQEKAISQQTRTALNSSRDILQAAYQVYKSEYPYEDADEATIRDDFLHDVYTNTKGDIPTPAEMVQLREYLNGKESFPPPAVSPSVAARLNEENELIRKAVAPKKVDTIWCKTGK
jgi:hypothetical protein